MKTKKTTSQGRETQKSRKDFDEGDDNDEHKVNGGDRDKNS